FQRVQAEVAVVREVVGRRLAVEDVVRAFGQQANRAVVAADEGAGPIGQVTELVRIHGDGVATTERSKGGVHRGRGKRLEAGGHVLAAAQAAVRVAEQCGEVAAPGRVDVDGEAETVRLRRVAHVADAID